MNLEKYFKSPMKKPRPLKIVSYEFSHHSLNHHFNVKVYNYIDLQFRPIYETPVPKRERKLIKIKLQDLTEYQDYNFCMNYDNVWKKYFFLYKDELKTNDLKKIEKLIKKIIKQMNTDYPKSHRNEPHFLSSMR